MIKVSQDSVILFNSITIFFFIVEAMFDLTICKLSDCSSSVTGGKELILLCDKVTRGNCIVAFL